MFLDNFILVVQQVAVLFILMAIGAVLFRIKMISDEGVSQMTSVLFWAVTPCLLVEAFSREFDPAVAKQLGLFALWAAVFTLVGLAAGWLIFSRTGDKRAVMSFGTAFSNCGFMGVPMANALYGEEGVMYASIFVAIFHILQWTIGYALLSGKEMSLKKLIINPGVIGIVISLPIFIFSIDLPSVIDQSVGYLADINTPLAMIIIGAQLAGSKLTRALTRPAVYAVSAVRLLLVPTLTLAFLIFAPSGLVTVAQKTLLLELAAPAAVTTAIISRQTGRDYELAGQAVAGCTLFSAFTMPVFATLGAMFLS